MNVTGTIIIEKKGNIRNSEIMKKNKTKHVNNNE